MLLLINSKYLKLFAKIHAHAKLRIRNLQKYAILHHRVRAMKATDLSDDPFVHVSAWPALVGQSSDASKKHQTWFGVIVKAINKLEARCAAFEQHNTDLTKKVTSLEKENTDLKKSANERSTGSWASLLSVKDGKRSAEHTTFLASLAKESRVVASIECNLVMHGLPVPVDGETEQREKDQLQELFENLGTDWDDVQSIRRLKPAATTTKTPAVTSVATPAASSSSTTATSPATTLAATSPASSSAGQPSRPGPYPLIVRFKTVQPEIGYWQQQLN